MLRSSMTWLRCIWVTERHVERPLSAAESGHCGHPCLAQKNSGLGNKNGPLRVRTGKKLGLGFLAMMVLSHPASGQEMRATLLGTGNPYPTAEQAGPSILVEAGERKYVFDVGRGSIQRLTQLGISYGEIDAVFFTHLHSDHIVGFPDFWLTGWLFSRRDRALRVFGPEGTKEMLTHLTAAYNFDTAIRVSDDGLPQAGSQFEVVEVADGYEWRDGNVSVRAFDVDHRPIDPALGYRIDAGDRSVALSGDTRYSESLIESTAGVDLLIHEAIAVSDAFRVRMPDAVAHHTTAIEVGQVFDRVRPRLGVITHLVSDIPISEVEGRIGSVYDGHFVIGVDLMRFDVGDTIQVNEP